MYYKIISGGLIVDACDGLQFVKWQEKNRLFLMWGEERGADGIISSDVSTIYLLEGAPEITGYAYATYEEITQEEYEELREELDAGGEIPAPDEPEPEPETDNPAKTRLQVLEETVAELTGWTARDNYAKGAFFVMHDEVWQATRAIQRGAEVRPGYNCARKTLDELR